MNENISFSSLNFLKINLILQFYKNCLLFVSASGAGAALAGATGWERSLEEIGKRPLLEDRERGRRSD